MLCGTNGAQRAFDGSSSGTPANIAAHNPHPPVPFTETIPLYINNGYDEKSDFAVMEVITWDRVLSEEEMVATVDYLKWKLRAGAVLETSEHVAQETEKNFDSWGNQNLYLGRPLGYFIFSLFGLYWTLSTTIFRGFKGPT